MAKVSEMQFVAALMASLENYWVVILPMVTYIGLKVLDPVLEKKLAPIVEYMCQLVEVITATQFWILVLNLALLLGIVFNLLVKREDSKEKTARIGAREGSGALADAEVLSSSSSTLGIELLPGSDFMKFSSTKSTMDKVMEALKDEDCDRVGIVGMGGIGKTTLVRALVAEMDKKGEDDKPFDQIVMIEVSRTQSISQIQSRIETILCMPFHPEVDQKDRAARLRLKIMSVQKILLVLDDVWEELDLVAIGIPNRVEHKGCKMVFVTRQEDVCSLMGVKPDKRIQVNVLSKEESWELFKEHAGIGVDSLPLKEVADDLNSECQGWPIAIATIGRALRDRKIGEWQAARREIKTLAATQIEGVDQAVISCIKLSYNYLKGDDAKLCFLLLSNLSPEDNDINIEDIVSSFSRTVDSIKKARDLVNVTIKDLEASRLLMKSDRQGFTKMQNVIRDVAVSIASECENHLWSRSESGLQHWTLRDLVKQDAENSSMAEDVQKLSEGSDSISGTGGQSEQKVLPEEISKYFRRSSNENPQSLPTNSKNLSVEANLDSKGLQAVLDLAKHLKPEHLDVKAISNYSDEAQEINTLIDLDEGSLNGLKSIWLTDLDCVRSLTGAAEGIVFADLEELLLNGLKRMIELGMGLLVLPHGSLQRLRVLGIVHCNDLCGAAVPSSWVCRLYNLEEVVIYHCKQVTKLFEINEAADEPEHTPGVLSSLRVLRLAHLPELLKIWNVKFVNLSNLTVVEIKHCNRLVFLFPTNVSQRLSHLEYLKIENCMKLEAISEEIDASDDSMHSFQFPNLKTVNVSNCDRLRTLFTISTAHFFPELEQLSVFRNAQLESIICSRNSVEEDKNIEVVRWPKLSRLQLHELSSLTRLCPEKCSIDLPLLKEFEFGECPKLKNFKMLHSNRL